MEGGPAGVGGLPRPQAFPRRGVMEVCLPRGQALTQIRLTLTQSGLIRRSIVPTPPSNVGVAVHVRILRSTPSAPVRAAIQLRTLRPNRDGGSLLDPMIW